MEGEGIMGKINLAKEEKQVQNLTGQIHHLPCCIKYDGPCVVSHYFKPKPSGIELEGLNVEESYFRGRKLQGLTLPLPSGYSGFVIEKKNECAQKRKASSCDDKSNKWEMNATFENITYWNHDCLPSIDDTFFRSFHWLSVAQALHKPVTAEDLASASFALKKN